MPGRCTKPDLAGVLASVVPGRVARLALEGEQKRALRDQEGQLALDVLRHYPHLLRRRPLRPVTRRVLRFYNRRKGRNQMALDFGDPETERRFWESVERKEGR